MTDYLRSLSTDAWFELDGYHREFDVPNDLSPEAVVLVANLLYDVSIPVAADPEEQTVTIRLQGMEMVGWGRTFEDAVKELEDDLRFRIADGPFVTTRGQEELAILLKLKIAIDEGTLAQLLSEQLHFHLACEDVKT